MQGTLRSEAGRLTGPDLPCPGSGLGVGHSVGAALQMWLSSPPGLVVGSPVLSWDPVPVIVWGQATPASLPVHQEPGVAQAHGAGWTFTSALCSWAAVWGRGLGRILVPQGRLGCSCL